MTFKSMVKQQKAYIISLILMLGLSCFCYYSNGQINDIKIISYVVNPIEKKIKFYWKNEKGENFKNFNLLKEWLSINSDTLIFAMNGGMYNKDLSPQGLYIENGKVLAKPDTAKTGYGNFYMKPNGIFYLTSDYKSIICETENFQLDSDILYATQSGPLLLINGEIHPKFNIGSTNFHIRNGVGVLPNGNIIFAMSKSKINFYDFALFFKNRGCKYALYLDGFVSRLYLPSANWIQLDGNFGVIIGQTK